jgi:hypothetical protein
MSNAIPWKGKFKIYVRAFAPFKVFGQMDGYGYHGDGRGYSNDKNASARLHHIIEIDSQLNTIKNIKNFCSETTRYSDNHSGIGIPVIKSWKAGTIKSYGSYKIL